MQEKTVVFPLKLAPGAPPVELRLEEPPLHAREDLNLVAFKALLRRLVLYFRYGETGDGVTKRDRVWLGVRRIASIIGVNYRLVQGVLEG